MAEHPDWNYWCYEHLPEGGYREVETSGGFLGEEDIRFNGYNLDVENWCSGKHFYWTAQEAALISFFRDPDKVERTEDDFIFHEEVMGPRDDDEDSKKNIELRQYITDLYGLIMRAQETRELPQRRLRRDLYIEWAQLEGVDIPQPVLDALKAVEREGQHATRAEVISDDGTSDGLKDQSSKKFESQQTRVANNLRKIIAAILIYTKQDKKDLAALSTALESILNERGLEMADRRMFLKASKIQERLAEALALDFLK
jgi:hypothetical protein